MITREPGVDGERFHVLGVWNVVTQELMVREDLELRGISYDALPQIFPTLDVPPYGPLGPPSSPQGPPPSPPPSPALPPQAYSESEAHAPTESEAYGEICIAVDISGSLKLIELNSDEEEP